MAEKQIERDERDKELGLTWRHFAAWKEKIFGGYLVVLAGLGTTIFGATSPAWRLAIFVAAIVVSVVFWLLDFRTSQLLNACQDAATRDSRVFAVLNEERKESQWWASYGFAIDVLVGAVVAASCASAYVYWRRLQPGLLGCITPTVGLAIFLLVGLAAQVIRRQRYKIEEQRQSDRDREGAVQ